MLRTQEEDGHLVAGDGRGRTVVPVTAAAGDALGGQLFDPRGGPEVGGDIREDGARGGGRCVG